MHGSLISLACLMAGAVLVAHDHRPWESVTVACRFVILRELRTRGILGTRIDIQVRMLVDL